MYIVLSDVHYLLSLSPIKLAKTTLYLSSPMMNLWRKTAIQLKNVPSNTSKQEIILRLEGLEIELQVKKVVQSESSEETTVILDSETGKCEKSF